MIKNIVLCIGVLLLLGYVGLTNTSATDISNTRVAYMLISGDSENSDHWRLVISDINGSNSVVISPDYWSEVYGISWTRDKTKLMVYGSDFSSENAFHEPKQWIDFYNSNGTLIETYWPTDKIPHVYLPEGVSWNGTNSVNFVFAAGDNQSILGGWGLISYDLSSSDTSVLVYGSGTDTHNRYPTMSPDGHYLSFIHEEWETNSYPALTTTDKLPSDGLDIYNKQVPANVTIFGPANSFTFFPRGDSCYWKYCDDHSQKWPIQWSFDSKGVFFDPEMYDQDPIVYHPTTGTQTSIGRCDHPLFLAHLSAKIACHSWLNSLMFVDMDGNYISTFYQGLDEHVENYFNGVPYSVNEWNTYTLPKFFQGKLSKGEIRHEDSPQCGQIDMTALSMDDLWVVVQCVNSEPFPSTVVHETDILVKTDGSGVYWDLSSMFRHDNEFALFVSL